MAGNYLLAQAEHALQWAADGEFSAYIKPSQAQTLLDELRSLREEIATLHGREKLRAQLIEDEQRARIEHHLGGRRSSR